MARRRFTENFLESKSLLGRKQTVPVCRAASFSEFARFVGPKLREIAGRGSECRSEGTSPAWGDLSHSGDFWPPNRWRCFVSFVAGQQTIPATLAKGSSTDCSGLILGDFTKLVIGIFGPALDIVVDRYSLKRQNMIEVTIFANVDWGLL